MGFRRRPVSAYGFPVEPRRDSASAPFLFIDSWWSYGVMLAGLDIVTP